jgi:tRNA(Ile)-lysidine synthase
MRQRAPDPDELVARCSFPAPGTHLELAVSGGPDSCGLALLTARAGLVATLHHVEHSIRATGAHETELVQRLAAMLGFGFVAHVVRVEAGGNLEARARGARRGVLPANVCTGHTMDDQAETVLLNLLRGTGVDGLGAMSPATKPMLALRRAEVRALVAASGVPVVVDSSNFDLTHRRNLIRARVLPELSGVARRDVVPLLARLASIAREDSSFLNELAASTVPDPADVDALRRAPDVLRRRRLRDLATSECDDGGHPPSAAEVDRIDAVVRGEVLATELHGGRRVTRKSRRLVVEGD